MELDIKKFMKAISDIGERKAENDYIKNGLIYCGNCNTPKQCKISISGEELTVNCMCDCAQKEAKELQKRDMQQRKMSWVKQLRAEGFDDKHMEESKFEKDDGKAAALMKTARGYVNLFAEYKEKGKGLLLFGGVGSGKTFAASCIANALIDMMYPVLMTNAIRISNQINEAWGHRQEYFDHLKFYDLIVIDDLFSERQTEFQNEQIYAVIDERYRSGKPLIVTTNKTSDDMKNPADIFERRIYSRLFEMCIPIDCGYKDRRVEKLKMSYEADLSKLKGE